MIRDDYIQAAIVAYLKSKTSITDELGTPGSTEIREDQWQGTNFDYPNVRVAMKTNTPWHDCGMEITFDILAFSEEASSQEVSRIAGIINDVLDGRGFTSNSYNFITWCESVIPATRRDEKTWRAGGSFRGIVSG